MKHKFGLAVVAAAILASASPASASVIVATWTGFVAADGYDNDGVFGSVGSLAREAFITQYTYDTSLGQLYTADSRFIAFSPIGLTAKLTIKNVSVEAASPGAGGIIVNLTPDIYYDNRVNSYDALIYNGSFSYIDIATVFDYLPTTQLARTFGAFSVDRYRGTFAHASGGLNALTLQIGPAPIPEPTTWALLISGFGVAGAMLRRRRLINARSSNAP